MYRLNNYLEPIIQINHSDYVQKLLFTPDEKILISQSYNDIKFWDVKIKKLLRTIEGDFSFLHDISISPDAKILAGGCEYIKFWNIDTGKLINIISGDFDWINNIVFTPDGNHVAVLTLRMNDFYDSDDALIINDTNELLDFVRPELWDINEKKRIWSKKIISEPSFLDCTEDGWLVYNDDNVIQLLNFRNPEDIKSLKGHSDLIHDIAFSPNGQLCASCSSDKTIIIWDIKTLEVKHIINEIDRKIYSLIFTQNGKNLIAGAEAEIIVLDIKKNKIITRLKSTSSKTMKNFSPPRIQSLAYSSEVDNLVAAVACSTGIEFWDINTSQLVETLALYYDYISSVAFSHDSKWLALKTTNRIIFWDLMKHRFINQIDLDTNIKSINFTSDGKLLGDSYEPGGYSIYTLYPEKEIQRYEYPKIYTNVINYDKNILIAGAENEIVFFDLKNKLYTKFKTSDFIIDYLSISPNGKLLSFISSKSIINIMNIEEKKVIKKFGNDSETVYATFFSPDSKVLAYFGDDNTIKILNVNNGEVIAKLEEKDFREIIFLAFSPDGKFLASVGDNKSITLWDIKNKKVAKKIVGHTNDVYFISFSPDGKFLVSLSSDKSVKLWDVKTSNLIATFIGFFDAFIVMTADGYLSGEGDFKKYVYFEDHDGNFYDFNRIKIL